MIADVPNPALANENFSRSSVVNVGAIPANSSISLSQYGKRFYLINSTAEIEIATDTSPFKPYAKGQGENFPEELRFKRLELRNNQSFPVLYRIWIGFGEYLDTTAEVIENYTVLVAHPFVGDVFPALTTITLLGAPSNYQIQRKGVILSNMDLANPLYIKDAAGNLAAAVFARQSINLPVSGEIQIYNNTAAPIPVCLSELWYSVNPW